ncbi:Actin-related protein [Komagataella phaffii CBS 7435]|uniref:Component of both the SWI/SNF and RSC chromatin remodeling complexes n=2 Tax=Komagataella phaffii TaxID=460519 RepID=C4R1J5_KOMPG|nr:uncharacterized protein PAS_chr2-1_0720 [Komagataella phaffii GS115]AOA61923.1 GQ67_00785T0 [Komagataella phaffii]CAH2448100.1 Actin-related protein [Komagataella phaffii CBS 7435]AOA68193.1 GQ68_00604T0 [Komagataella phaffii GS115]CAY69369.1 Component of both the SWI/SNF and RSC chromatin remodeling complexes [Komagataella phaffii GS115]CCA38245.1 Actin-related protein [Komagataella phaffii CBS 7435]
MAPYNEDNFLIIQPGSYNTLFRLGLEESLSPPKYSIPTKVYRDPSNPNKFQSKSSDESLAIYPIVNGEIVDVAAFNFLLRLILRSLINANPLMLTNNVALLLVSSIRWSNLNIEYITKYVFETLQLTALQIIPLPLASAFAHGSIPNCCVIDLGGDKFDVSPILNFQVIKGYSRTVPTGSSTINKRLKQLLPNLNDSQIENLKRSSIFESLSEEDAKNSFFGLEGIGLEDDTKKNPEDDGILDIAAIVTSEKSTKEILEDVKGKKEKTSKQSEVKPNSVLETNSFVTSDGTELTIGKERFQGCDELVRALGDTVFECLSNIIDSTKRQECYDNLILSGNTWKIKGLKESFLVYLLNTYGAKYPISSEAIKQKVSKRSKADAVFRNETDADSSNQRSEKLVQVPQHVKLVKFPEYFTEWKDIGHEDNSFLGAQIFAKQVFGHHHNHNSNNGGGTYLNKDDYLERGPLGIWDVVF